MNFNIKKLYCINKSLIVAFEKKKFHYSVRLANQDIKYKEKKRN